MWSSKYLAIPKAIQVNLTWCIASIGSGRGKWKDVVRGLTSQLFFLSWAASYNPPNESFSCCREPFAISSPLSTDTPTAVHWKESCIFLGQIKGMGEKSKQSPHPPCHFNDISCALISLWQCLHSKSPSSPKDETGFTKDTIEKQQVSSATFRE